MVERRIYLVRHGETDGNRFFRHQIRSIKLNECGIQQALSVARALAARPLRLIITSGATRAQQTALPLLNAVHCPVINNPLFEELRRPTTAMGKSYFNPRAVWSIMRVYLYGHNTHQNLYGGETITGFQQRAEAAVELLSTIQEREFVVVSHRVFLSGMLAVMTGSTHRSRILFLRAAFRFRHIPNGSITELTYNPDRRAPWHIERFISAAHLLPCRKSV